MQSDINKMKKLWDTVSVAVCTASGLRAKRVRWGGRETRPYPAECSRPPWAPGWCLRCGVPGWKALPHLPPLSGSAQEKTLWTLRGGDEKEGVRAKREQAAREKGNDMQNNSPKKILTTFGHQVAMQAFVPSPTLFLFTHYWSRGPAVHLLYSKITLHRGSRFWSNQRCSSKGPLRKFFLAAWRVALNYTCRPLTANQ